MDSNPSRFRQACFAAVAAVTLGCMFAAAMGDGNSIFLLASMASLLAIAAFHLVASPSRTLAWFGVGWVTAFVLFVIVLASLGRTPIIVRALGAKPESELLTFLDSAAGSVGAIAVLSTLLALVAAMCVSIDLRRWGVVGATVVLLLVWWALWSAGVSRRDRNGELFRDDQVEAIERMP